MKVIDHGYDGPDQTAYALFLELAQELAHHPTSLVCEIYYSRDWRKLQMIWIDHDLLSGYPSYRAEVESDADGIALPMMKLWVTDTVVYVSANDGMGGAMIGIANYDLSWPGSIDSLRALLISKLDHELSQKYRRDYVLPE